MFTPDRSAGTLVAALACCALLNTSAPAANLTVDAATQYQVVNGLGVNVNVDSWNDGEIVQAIDLLVDVNGTSLVRVIRDPMDWVTSESLIPLLHDLDPATLAQVYETPAMQDIWGTLQVINQKGLGGRQVELTFMGWTPPWLGGSGCYGKWSTITPGKEPQFATMIASLVYYAKRVKNLDFTLLSPLNECDHDGLEGPEIGPSQYVNVMTAVISELDHMGLTEIRLVGPETAGGPSSYISAMMANATVAGRTDHLACHSYSGSAAVPGTSYPGKNYWMTETSAWCSGCDQNGTPSQGEFSFAALTADVLIGDLLNGFGAVVVWEGFDSFYFHHNSSSSWGTLDYAAGVYTPRKRFYVYAQLNRFIRPGARRIQISESITGLGPVVAFRDDVRGTIAIVGHVTSSSPVSVQGQLNNLPFAVTSLVHYQTSATIDLQQQANVPVTAGAFDVTLPANTFFSLVGGNAPAAVDPLLHDALRLSEAFPNPTRADAAFTLSLASEEDVSLSVIDIQGREVWSAPARRYAPGVWPLSWNGRTREGAASPGIYLARVRVGDRELLRRIAVIH
jgi:O-glycosyl hydrolase